MATSSVSVSLKLLIDKQTPKSFYRCSNSRCYCDLYDYFVTNCPICNRAMIRLNLKHGPREQSSSEGVFVRGLVTYMVTDDLLVKPLSTLSTIELLHEFDFKDMGQLELKEVNMGMNEALKMLKACMHSNNILTEVFLKPETENRECTSTS